MKWWLFALSLYLAAGTSPSDAAIAQSIDAIRSMKEELKSIDVKIKALHTLLQKYRDDLQRLKKEGARSSILATLKQMAPLVDFIDCEEASKELEAKRRVLLEKLNHQLPSKL